MLPTIPITPCTPFTSRSLLRYRFALCSYGCRCFALISFFLRSAFTAGAPSVAMFTLAAIAACIAWRIPIAGSCGSFSFNLFIREQAGKQGSDAEDYGGNQF